MELAVGKPTFDLALSYFAAPEFTTWPSRTDARTAWIIPSAVAALFVGVIFLLQVL